MSSSAPTRMETIKVAGTYYQKIPGLSSANTTNWVVLNAPLMLLEGVHGGGGEIP